MSLLAQQNSQALKKLYQPDLNELLSQCELNYLLCFKLWPALFSEKQSVSSDCLNNRFEFISRGVSLMADVTDRAKYTTTLNVVVKAPTKNISEDISLIVRLYHDAKMLEVMEGSGPGSLKPVLENSKEKKPVDEKRQINRFIGECLGACLKLANKKSD